MRVDSLFHLLSASWTILLISVVFLSSCSKEHPGEAVYLAKCSQCHGISGQGLRQLYPPLDNSSFLATQARLLPCLIQKGSIILEEYGAGTPGRFMPPVRIINHDELFTLLDYLQQRFAADPVSIKRSDFDTWLAQCDT